MRHAIIDLGSNAIRASVYEKNTLGSVILFNQKFKSDTASLLSKDSFDVKHGIYTIFDYFSKIFDNLNVTKVTCVATEILRAHERSFLFVEEVYKRFGIKIDILTGNEEAKLSALGVISSLSEADGISVDLGGGSLEIAEIKDKKVIKVESIRRQSLPDNSERSGDNITRYISNAFANKKYQTLYLIGGTFRLLGLLYIDYTESKIKNLHNLTISVGDFLYFLEKAYLDLKNLKSLKFLSITLKSIQDTTAVVNFFSPDSIVISTYGLKEGVRFVNLPIEEQDKDLVIERCKELDQTSSVVNLNSYLQLVESIGIELPLCQRRLFFAALFLTRATKMIDQNFGFDYLCNFMLNTDIPFSHSERAILISIFLSSHNGYNQKTYKFINVILSKKELALGQILGAIIKITFLVEGGLISSPSFSIVKKEHYLEIVHKNIMPKILFDKICQQLKILSSSIRTYGSSK
ncbi:MAG: hypothetical protein SFT93_04710 [Rickettsiaceae bacterium]|nr:hypothetical protein [Rickettsiaceae bacterium]